MGLVILFLIGILQVVILNVCVEFRTRICLIIANFLTFMPIIGVIALAVFSNSANDYDPNSNFYDKNNCRFRHYVFDNGFVKWLIEEKW